MPDRELRIFSLNNHTHVKYKPGERDVVVYNSEKKESKTCRMVEFLNFDSAVNLSGDRVAVISRCEKKIFIMHSSNIEKPIHILTNPDKARFIGMKCLLGDRLRATAQSETNQYTYIYNNKFVFRSRVLRKLETIEEVISESKARPGIR